MSQALCGEEPVSSCQPGGRAPFFPDPDTPRGFRRVFPGDHGGAGFDRAKSDSFDRLKDVEGVLAQSQDLV